MEDIDSDKKKLRRQVELADFVNPVTQVEVALKEMETKSKTKKQDDEPEPSTKQTAAAANSDRKAPSSRVGKIGRSST